jgi:predicted amidohydrolase YtcJ
MLATSLSATALPARADNVAWTNGRWWNGAAFIAMEFYSTEGVLRAAAPPHIDRTVDLKGQYILPPLAEGHNHWLEPLKARQYSECYLADGVFYVRDMANLPYVADTIRPLLNKVDTVDWVSAMEGFTGPNAHPVEVFAQLVSAGVLPKDWKPDFDGQAEFVVRSKREIDARFPLLLRQHPALVKAFLAHSEDYAANLSRPGARAQMRGMDPKLLPYLVGLAHRAGLKIAVHAYTAADFRAVISSGADEAAHLPGSGYRPKEPIAQYRITRADAEAAVHAGVKVDTTVSWLMDLKDEDPAAYRIATDEIVVPNLKLLKTAGAQFIAGSDTFRQDVLPELLVLHSLKVFTDAELIRMATETTPAAIFPERKIGRLVDGYEANFIVLTGDPTSDISQLKSISARVKHGGLLSLPLSATRRASSACVEGPP